MPSIEIVSIGQKKPTDLTNFPLAVRSETELLSHRGLFQKDLDRLTGVIDHLGNPRFKTEGTGSFANELLTKDGLPEPVQSVKYHQFNPQLKSDRDNPKSQYPDSAIMILADRTDVLKQRSDLHHC